MEWVAKYPMLGYNGSGQTVKRFFRPTLAELNQPVAQSRRLAGGWLRHPAPGAWNNLLIKSRLVAPGIFGRQIALNSGAASVGGSWEVRHETEI